MWLKVLAVTVREGYAIDIKVVSLGFLEPFKRCESVCRPPERALGIAMISKWLHTLLNLSNGTLKMVEVYYM